MSEMSEKYVPCMVEDELYCDPVTEVKRLCAENGFFPFNGDIDIDYEAKDAPYYQKMFFTNETVDICIYLTGDRYVVQAGFRHYYNTWRDVRVERQLFSDEELEQYLSCDCYCDALSMVIEYLHGEDRVSYIDSLMTYAEKLGDLNYNNNCHRTPIPFKEEDVR